MCKIPSSSILGSFQTKLYMPHLFYISTPCQQRSHLFDHCVNIATYNMENIVIFLNAQSKAWIPWKNINKNGICKHSCSLQTCCPGNLRKRERIKISCSCVFQLCITLTMSFNEMLQLLLTINELEWRFGLQHC